MEQKAFIYEAPEVEVLAIEVEKGFAASAEMGGEIPGWQDGGTL